MKTQSIQLFLQSVPYWSAYELDPDYKEFHESVKDLSVSSDLLNLKLGQYVGLITDKESMMSMPEDDRNQRLIKHLRKLNFFLKALAEDLDGTIDEITENGLVED